MDSQPEQCLDENLLRAYLDEGALLEAAIQAKIKTHLAECQLCSTRLAALTQQKIQVNTLLEEFIPAHLNEPDPHEALNRLRLRYPQVVAQPAHPKPDVKTQKTLAEVSKVNRKNRRALGLFGLKFTRAQSWVAALAMLILVTGLLTLTPLSAAASQLLQIFRARDTLFVPVNQDQLQQLVNAGLKSNNFFLGTPTVNNNSAASHPVDSVEAASKAVGFTVQKPQVFPGPPSNQEILIREGLSVQFQVNVPALRQILALMKITDLNLPDELGSQPVKAELPAFVEQHFDGKNYQMVLYQSLSPQLNLPDKVDVAQLSQIALRLLGMNAQQAQSLSQQIDLRSVLIFPFPARTNNFRQVTVGSGKGLLVNTGERGTENWLLYWQQGEHFFVLFGSGKLNDLDMLAAANSLA